MALPNARLNGRVNGGAVAALKLSHLLNANKKTQMMMQHAVEGGAPAVGYQGGDQNGNSKKGSSSGRGGGSSSSSSSSSGSTYTYPPPPANPLPPGACPSCRSTNQPNPPLPECKKCLATNICSKYIHHPSSSCHDDTQHLSIYLSLPHPSSI